LQIVRARSETHRNIGTLEQLEKMDSLKQLEKKFLQATCGEEKKQNPKQPVESSEFFFDPGKINQQVKPPVDVSINHICSTCSDSEWWVDIHGGGPHCSNCKPPAVDSFVRWRFFFDEHGSKWNITVEKKFEVWQKES